MWKEIVISIIIIAIIFIGNDITQNYTIESAENLSNKLGELKEKIENVSDSDDSNQELNDKLNEIWQDWESRHDKLAYYIEHNELEKVEDDFTGIKTYLESKEYAEAISELDESTFVLRHIKEKYEFNLQNIF